MTDFILFYSKLARQGRCSESKTSTTRNCDFNFSAFNGLHKRASSKQVLFHGQMPIGHLRLLCRYADHRFISKLFPSESFDGSLSRGQETADYCRNELLIHINFVTTNFDIYDGGPYNKVWKKKDSSVLAMPIDMPS